MDILLSALELLFENSLFGFTCSHFVHFLKFLHDPYVRSTKLNCNYINLKGYLDNVASLFKKKLKPGSYRLGKNDKTYYMEVFISPKVTKVIYVYYADKNFFKRFDSYFIIDGDYIKYIANNRSASKSIYEAILNLHKNENTEYFNFLIELVSIITKHSEFRIFGGFLRDLFLNITPKDLDFVIVQEKKEKIEGIDGHLNELVYYLRDHHNYSVTSTPNTNERSTGSSIIYRVSKGNYSVDVDFSIEGDTTYKINSKNEIIPTSPTDFLCNLLIAEDNFKLYSRHFEDNYKKIQPVHLLYDIMNYIVRPTCHYDEITRRCNSDVVYRTALKFFRRSIKMMDRGWTLVDSHSYNNTSYKFVRCALDSTSFNNEISIKRDGTFGQLVEIFIKFKLPNEIIHKIIFNYLTEIPESELVGIKNPITLFESFIYIKTF